MTIEALSRAISTKTGSPVRTMILMKLAYCAGEDGICRMPQLEIARECEISERSVRTHIKALERRGLIEVVPSYYGNTRGRTGTTYKLKI